MIKTDLPQMLNHYTRLLWFTTLGIPFFTTSRCPNWVSLSYRTEITSKSHQYDGPWRRYQSLSNTNYGLFFSKNWALFLRSFHQTSRWWFQIFFIFTLNIGEDSHFDSYFSNGLVQPPTRKSSPLLLFHDVARKAKTAFLQCSLGSFYPSAQVVEAGRDQWGDIVVVGSRDPYKWVFPKIMVSPNHPFLK